MRFDRISVGKSVVLWVTWSIKGRSTQIWVFIGVLNAKYNERICWIRVEFGSSNIRRFGDLVRGSQIRVYRPSFRILRMISGKVQWDKRWRRGTSQDRHDSVTHEFSLIGFQQRKSDHTIMGLIPRHTAETNGAGSQSTTMTQLVKQEVAATLLSSWWESETGTTYTRLAGHKNGETWFGFVQQFQFHFGYDRVFTVEPSGASGGLALFYNNSYDVNIVCSNKRIIDIEARYEGKVIFLSFVYGDPVVKWRDLVWERITRIGTTRTDPWFLIGDFNEITGNHEKQGGALRQASSFVSFNLMISDCGLVDFPSRGNKLSWRGRRRQRIVRCRLDRALATEDWHELFPVSHVEYLPTIGSDHRPILPTLDSKIAKRQKQFRFDKRWIGLEGLLESIKQGWNNNRGEVAPGLVDRINNCRHEISVWRKEKKTHGKQQIEELQQALEEVQNDDNNTQEELIDITNKLKEAYRDEEAYWKQKSWNMWLKDGDLNTKFFHASTKQRRAVNRIVGLHNEANVWVAEDKEVERIAIGYFDKLFTSLSLGDFTGVLKNIPHRISDHEN
ncbi:unnamed protein product [Microthlaspi erraticum]|uniref:Endonuclease/exonuclease/phosphatase domain-containing protein n=1 Tax=Microthlaspi erraticum TaxID=1685480 RepID=A0A6D2HVK0_9BRAS|nr:unnamed protein product [Microthlaspi erraticum]